MQKTPTFLHPRPITHPAVSLALLPLLPIPPPVELPWEIWKRILHHAVDTDTGSAIANEIQLARLSLIRVCKAFNTVVLPSLYFEPHLLDCQAFLQFRSRLIDADRKWDNLRRIKHSIPGRWVNTLDLSLIHRLTPTQHLQFDKAVADVLSVTPFLKRFVTSPTVGFSRQTLESLADAEVRLSLTYISGLRIPSTVEESPLLADAIIDFIGACPNIHCLELIGTGMDLEADIFGSSSSFDTKLLQHSVLPNLESLSIQNGAHSPIVHALCNAELPMLKRLTISLSKDEVPSEASAFLTTHAHKLEALTLTPAQTWPSIIAPIPNDILILASSLQYLSLPVTTTALLAPESAHPLRTLSVPRPTMEFLNQVIPFFPSLREIRIRDVRYLRSGMGRSALGAGSSAIILEWKNRLARRRIKVLDSLGRDGN